MRDPKIHPLLDARALETNEVFRRVVGSSKVVSLEPTALVLETDAHATTWNDAPLPEVTGERPWRDRGTVRLDVVSDAILRVRYSEADTVVENDTRMVVGRPPAPADARSEQRDDRIVLTTSEISAEVFLRPWALRVRDRRGKLLCEAGGQVPTPFNMGSADRNHFQRWDNFHLGVHRTMKGARPVASECFTLGSHEAVYGLGEQFLRLNKVGQTIDLTMIEPVGIGTPRSYKNVPFFVSTRGYGAFFNHSCRMTAWLGSMHAAEVQIGLEDDFVDYYLFFGSIKDVLDAYTTLTGKAKVPPKWSFGFWQSKISYASADEAREVVDQTRKAGFPLDVLHIDTNWFKKDWYCDLEFDEERFPDPAAMMKELAERGVKVSLWQLPYIPEGSRLYDAFEKAGGFVKNEAGETYDVGICYTGDFKGKVGCIDFTNPKGVEVYQAALRRLLSLGARCIKADFGEEAPLDGVYHDGTPGHRMRNLYPLLYNRAVAEVTREVHGESIIWARSAWAGSQRYPLHWGGDSSTNWDNMVPQIEGGLSLGLSGFQFWSQDIGGFIGFTGGEMLARWMQLGLFLSHSRIHGMGPRELYAMDEPTQAVCRKYLELRYRLLPYLWATADDSVARSLPMARALVVEYQDDPNVWNIGDEWLLGDALLVAPITTPENERAVYLPRGTWVDWWTGEVLSGECWRPVEAELDVLPLFVREGAIVPMGPKLAYVGERPIDELTVKIAPHRRDAESAIVVPLDDGEVTLRYVARGGRHEVTVSGTSLQVTLDVIGGDAPEVGLTT